LRENPIPARAEGQGSEFPGNEETDTVYVYRGPNSYHAVWFVALGGSIAVVRKEEFVPDEDRIAKNLTAMGFA
jgi:hypothetical protein